MKKILYLFLLSLFLIGCQKNIPNDDQITIGIFEPISGQYQESGKEIVKGIRLAQKERQYILGKKVKLELFDTKSLEYETANGVSFLAGSAHAQGLIGTYGVESMSNALPVIEAAKIPTVASASTYSKINSSQWAVSLAPNDYYQATAMAQFAEDVLQLKNIAIVFDEELLHGEMLSYTFANQLSKNVKTTSIHYHTGDTTFRSQMARLRKLSIDGIYCPGDSITSASLIQEIRKEFPYISIMGGDRWENPSFYAIGKEDVDGVYFTAPFTKDRLTTSRAVDFVNRYQKEYGTAPNSYAALGYDSYYLLAEAFEKAESTDPHKVQYHLQKIRGMEGAIGRMDPGNQDQIKSINILQQQKKSAILIKTVEVIN
ncbi:ABC transporter substrate-binding protein [Peptoniphilus sp. KCTC 25270]|uniref:ABC transporter substrate-binding protein n=1 Tax=Peptoniphilus sp. KCTC 25270 TaxID=2897414 RepID=UPI001E578F6A|nr:ABC transporter substrate-binding protein [Peptoniphilus sp. KCTC 25270]MCD1147723.1 ABC transporter substrate-binding protein [Peptoniphilus sp. KCTC 25270]